jgi:Na+-driven multidrug efflux pump
MVSAGLILFLFRYQLVSFFTDQKQIIDIACGSIIFISLSQWFDAMNVTYLHALQGTGDTKWTSKATIILSVIILGGGGAISVIFFKDQGSSLIWALAMTYSIFQGSLFRKRWNSNAWQHLNLRS